MSDRIGIGTAIVGAAAQRYLTYKEDHPTAELWDRRMLALAAEADRLQADRDRWKARADALATALRAVEGLIDPVLREPEDEGAVFRYLRAEIVTAVAAARAVLREYDEEAGR